MPIEDRFYVTLKGGKQYPVYAGVLLEATRLGLKSLTTELIQIPNDENGGCAIVRARAEFEDGRIFIDYGDCSPKNAAPMIAAAAIRMASTRGKGRVLRDGIGLGETMAEEIPDGGHDRDEEQYSPPIPRTPREVGNGHNHPAPVSAPGQTSSDGITVCQEPGCGAILTPGQRTMSLRRYGKALCPDHQKGAPVLTTIG